MTRASYNRLGFRTNTGANLNSTPKTTLSVASAGLILPDRQTSIANRRLRRQRNGIATLELVMCLPILVFLVAMLFTLFFATTKKSQITMDSRMEAWRFRTEPNAGTAEPYGILDAAASGAEKTTLTDRVSSYENWYPGVPRDVVWGNTVLTGSWDHRQTNLDGSLPHLGSVVEIAVAIPPGRPKINVGQIQQVNSLISFPGL